jgi:hypothetical protein
MAIAFRGASGTDADSVPLTVMKTMLGRYFPDRCNKRFCFRRRFIFYEPWLFNQALGTRVIRVAFMLGAN